MHFIDIYEAMRRDLGYTAAEMARLCDVASNLTTAWRRKPETEPQPKVLRRIADGVSIDWVRDPDTGRISGWRKRRDAGGMTSEPAPNYGGNQEERDITRFRDLFLGKIFGKVERVRRNRSTHSPEGDPMEQRLSSRYDALYEILLNDLETIAQDAAAMIDKRIREFENEVLRMEVLDSGRENGET